MINHYNCFRYQKIYKRFVNIGEWKRIMVSYFCVGI